MSHRMQHPNSPTWCIDCGTFDFACNSVPCKTPGSGDFDQETGRGEKRIVLELAGTFGVSLPDVESTT